MTNRRNEESAMIRQEPLAYVCSFDANNLPIYQAWASVGTLLTSATWVVCKNTYDASNNLTRTKWAVDSSGRVGYFSNSIGSDDTTPDFSGLTFV